MRGEKYKTTSINKNEIEAASAREKSSWWVWYSLTKMSFSAGVVQWQKNTMSAENYMMGENAPEDGC